MTTETNHVEARENRKNYFLRHLGSIPEGMRERVAEKAIANQDRYYALLRSTQLEGVEELITAIHNSSFSTAHSHSHHHYPTGTMAHCLGVYDVMKASAKPGQFTDTELILVALLHDVCMGHSIAWHPFAGHGRRSLAIAKHYLPALSQPEYSEVALAIGSHRHKPIGNHPLWSLVRRSDMKDASTCNFGYAL